MGDQWLSSIKLYYRKNVKICIQLQQKWLSSSESLQKSTYKAFKQFFYISNCFRVIRCQKRVFDLVPSPYCDILVNLVPRLLPSHALNKTLGTFLGTRLHFGPIFTFKTAITQRLFEGSKNCLNVLYSGFCKLSDDASHFCCNWIQSFTFSCCNTI
jgi:hypothetical protein